ncbi:HemK2/MTQ2 family protein methyltransferase [Nanoarchaeota archaeon]
MSQVYEPQEDSYLLAEQVKKYAKGNVLDMGTGSGIQAITASKCKNVKKVTAVDVNPKAIKQSKKNALHQGIKNIKFIEGYLFDKVKGKFDTIIFNPPYLPDDIKAKDVALDGGKKGYEVLGKFIQQVNNHLNPNGKVLFIFSSLTNKQKVNEFLEENMLDFEEIASQGLFMEKLFVYIIEKSNIRRELEKKGVNNLQYFDHGKRGLIFTGIYKKKKVAIKIKRPSSEAHNRIENEVYWLKRLNKKNIGPNLFLAGKGYLVYEFVEGDFILDYIEKSNKTAIKKTLKAIFKQLLEMEEMKVNKEEMHHPIKHIIVNKKPTMIDFERCHISKDLKNVTQFCQFLSGHLCQNLNAKGLKYTPDQIRAAAKQYKEDDNIEAIYKVINI